MRRLIRLHRYLSCFVAPAMMFFAISGAWQAFRLHETRKDGSYTAPATLKQLTDLHKAEDLEGASGEWFRRGQVILSIAFVSTALIGVVMAFRIARPVWPVLVCLAAGVALPVLLALAARAG